MGQPEFQHRKPKSSAFADTAGPVILLTALLHSLGGVITFNCLSDPCLADVCSSLVHEVCVKKSDDRGKKGTRRRVCYHLTIVMTLAMSIIVATAVAAVSSLSQPT